MSVYNFLVSGPKFTRLIRYEMSLIKCYSDFRYVDAFQRYSRSKSKVVNNRAEFWIFIAFSKFCRGHPLYN